MDPVSGPAVGRPPLGLDPPERGEIGKGRRVGGRRNHAGAAPLLTVVSALDLLVGGQLAAGVGRYEGLQRAGKERPVVGLQLQSVVATLGVHRFGHARIVGGDDAAFQGQMCFGVQN